MGQVHSVPSISAQISIRAPRGSLLVRELHVACLYAPVCDFGSEHSVNTLATYFLGGEGGGQLTRILTETSYSHPTP